MLPLLEEPAIPMGTLKKRIEDPREITDPNVVKVVTDRFENAIYFSRSTIPFTRDDQGIDPAWRITNTSVCMFIGADFLLRYPDLPVGPLEQAEKLEQLRALENGFNIRVVETDYESLGVDTPADLERVQQLIRAGQAAVKRRSAGADAQ